MEQMNIYKNSYSKRKRLDYYQQLSKTLIPKIKKHEIQAFWTNHQGDQCKKIIEPNRCFCSHSFEQHLCTNGQPYCAVPGCKCRCYEYVPYYDIKCMCRHSYKDHDKNTRMCKMCKRCLGFLTNWSCKCGFTFGQHQTVMKMAKKKKQSHLSNQGSQILRNLSNISKRVGFMDEEQKEGEKGKQKEESYKYYEQNKFGLKLEVHRNREERLSLSRRKVLEKINKKYGAIGMQNEYEQKNEEKVLGKARQISPLELYLKPHGYRAVKIKQLTVQTYDIYDKNVSHLLPR